MMRSKRYLINRLRLFMLALVMSCIVLQAHAAPPNIMVSGVMYSQKSPAAYINGQLLRIGDTVDGYELIKITHSGIRVKNESGKKIYFIPVAKPEEVREIRVDEPAVKTAVEKTNAVVEAQAEEPAEEEWQTGVSVMSTETAETPEEAEAAAKPEFEFDTGDVKLMSALLLIGIGFLLSFVASIWYIVACFQESVWWGLGSLFVPFVQLIFLFMHWDRAKNPFLLSLLASLLMIGAILLVPETAATFYDY